MPQQLNDLLDLGTREVVSFVGAGGKTTAMFTLAKELSIREKVLVTTTTKIKYTTQFQVVLAENADDALEKLRKASKFAPLVVLGKSVVRGKLHGIPSGWIDKLGEFFPYILVEADGSAQKPLKGHAAWEPVVPPASTTVVGISGMPVLGKPLLAQHVHRPELLSTATGYPLGAAVTTWIIARAHEEMVKKVKQQAPAARRIGLLNQANMEKQTDRLAKYLVSRCYERVVLGSLLPSIQLQKISGTAEMPVTGIVLAAGQSRRMGKVNKLLLPWEGKTIIRHVVENSIQALGREVIVVVGHQKSQIQEELAALPVRFAVNHQFSRGQATSLKVGLAATGENCRGAMIILGDQPLVPAALLSTMAAAFMLESPPALYPVFMGQRGNPVIFHKSHFPGLLATTGDQGGRQLLQQLQKEAIALPTNVHGVVADIDSPADWERYQK